MGRLAYQYGTKAALLATVTGPVTLLKNLVGEAMLKLLRRDLNEVERLFDKVGEVLSQLCQLYCAQGVDIGIIADSMLNEVHIRLHEAIPPILKALCNIAKYHKVHMLIAVGECKEEDIEIIFDLPSDGILIGAKSNLEIARNCSREQSRCLGIGISSECLLGKRGHGWPEICKYLDRVEDRKGIHISTEWDIPYETPINNSHEVAGDVCMLK